MNKSLRKIFFLFIIVAISFGSGFAVSDFMNSLDSKSNIEGLVNLDNNKDIEIKNKADFSIFWDAWNIVEDKYALELDYQKMVYGSISGMVNSLGDPYSVFLDPEENKMFEDDMKGSFEGIGAEIGFRNKYLTVIAPLKDSPAEKAGILAGDRILKVDDKDIIEMSLDEAVRLIRGKKGTEVKLTISRDGLDKLKEIEIIRDIIVIKTV
jgi:carboxyl-terminal processing protease